LPNQSHSGPVGQGVTAATPKRKCEHCALLPARAEPGCRFFDNCCARLGRTAAIRLAGAPPAAACLSGRPFRVK